MPYEYPTPHGILCVRKIRRQWVVEFNGARRGAWPSPDAAVLALARRQSGLPEWDSDLSEVSPDLIDWRPLDDSL